MHVLGFFWKYKFHNTALYDEFSSLTFLDFNSIFQKYKEFYLLLVSK